MKRRKFKNALVSFLLVIVVGISYVGNGLILNKFVSKRRETSTRVVYNPNNHISSLGFSYGSVQGFLDSLQNFIELGDCNTLDRVNVIATSEGDLLETYENPSKTVSVMVAEDGSIVNCKFKNLSPNSEDMVRKLAMKYNGDGTYKVKEVNNGFILESTAV